MKLIVIFILMLLVTTATATTGNKDITNAIENTTQAIEDATEAVQFILELFERKVWAGDWSVADDEGTPEKDWKSSGGISAWIDITGFRNMSIIDNVSYVNGSPCDNAIVKRGAKYSGIDGTMTSFKSTCTITDCNITNTTTATQKTTLKWKECHTVHTTTESSRDYTVCNSYTKTLKVSCTVDSPNNFTTRIPDLNISVTKYNRSISPMATVYIMNENHSSMKHVVIVNITYNGSSVCRYDQIGEVTENDRGAEYVLFVDDGRYPLWITDENQTQIWNRGDLVIIPGANFNISLLNISLQTPYETKYITNFTIIEESECVKLPIVLIKIILLAGGAIYVTVLMWRRVL